MIETEQYYLDYYIPSILLVSMSWVSFWLEPSAIPGRTTLGGRKINDQIIIIVSISGTGSWLTYINLHKNINDNVSRVHYIKYIDIWFLVSTFFIFLSLVEFAIVNSIHRGNYPVSRKTVKTVYSLLCLCSNKPRETDRFVQEIIILNSG